MFFDKKLTNFAHNPNGNATDALLSNPKNLRQFLLNIFIMFCTKKPNKVSNDIRIEERMQNCCFSEIMCFFFEKKNHNLEKQCF